MNDFQLNPVKIIWSLEGALKNTDKFIVSRGCHLHDNKLRRFDDAQETSVFVRVNIKSYFYPICNGKG